MEREWLVGAEFAAQYILRDLWAYVYMTGDVAAWRSRCLPVSYFCADVADYVDKMHQKGRWQAVGRVMFEGTRSSWVTIDGESRYVVEFVRIENGTRLLDESGRPIRADLSDRADAVVNLLYLDGRWVIRELEVRQPL